jgi:hypothetical protein
MTKIFVSGPANFMKTANRSAKPNTPGVTVPELATLTENTDSLIVLTDAEFARGELTTSLTIQAIW